MNYYEMDIEDQEIYRELFCGGGHPMVLDTDDARTDYSGGRCRVLSADEWSRMQADMSDEEKAALAYER